MPSTIRKLVTQNNNSSLAAAILFYFGSIASTNALATPDLADFNLVFFDEFNGSTLDSSKWNTGLLWGPYLPINNEEQLYVDEFGINAGSMLGNGGNTPSPFEMTGNSLKIIATPVSDPSNIPARPSENAPIWYQYAEYRYTGDDPNDPTDQFYDPENVNYLSGIITSYDSFRFTHGYAEARVKLPEGQGLWPAFWLLTSFYVEDVPEIDIMEFLGHDKETLYHTYHYFEPQNNWNKVSTPSYTSSHVDFTADWHTFGVNWTPTEIIWYVDGVEARRISASDYNIPNQAMYVIANLATGGNWPGSPDNTTPFPAEFELDYIRVYQKEAPETITQSTLNSDYELMFEDNFDGNSLDTSKWNTHHLWGPYWQINNEQQFYPDVTDTHADESFISPPVSVNGGTLKLTADVISPTDLPALPPTNSSTFTEHPEWRRNTAYNNPAYQNNNSDPSQAFAPFLPDYTSGIVTTYDSFKFTHGYAEIRANLPKGDGLWPAFWLLNGYYVDQQPEIDVIELRGEIPGELVHSYHLSPKDNGPPSYTWSSFSNATDGFANSHHTFGIAWEPGKLDWYVDGVKKYTHTGDSVSSQNMYLILNLAAGGNFNFQPVDESILPASFEIDYVKIYQLNNQAESHTCNGFPATIVGSAANDVIYGTELDDVIIALGGDDQIQGNGGNDIICAGLGNDIVDAGSGNDWINAGGGDDQVKGGLDDDIIFGDLGDDVIRGSRGNDTIDGGNGNDSIDGGWGDDALKGGPDNDNILGNLGNDVIRGSRGNDTLDGGFGTDDLHGGWGNDFLKGGPDDDVLDGGRDNDTLRGSKGDDVLRGGHGIDSLHGGVEGANGDTCYSDLLDSPLTDCESQLTE